MFVPFGKQPGPAALAVPFVLPAQSEDWDRPRGSQPVPAPPRLPPSLCCWFLAANPLPLGLLGHAGGRGSGCFPQLRPRAGSAPSRVLPREKDSALKFSAGCLCEYPPALLSFPDSRFPDLGCAGIRGEEQGGTCWRRPRSRLLQTPNPLGNGMLRSAGFGRSSPLSASQKSTCSFPSPVKEGFPAGFNNSRFSVLSPAPGKAKPRPQVCPVFVWQHKGTHLVLSPGPCSWILHCPAPAHAESAAILCKIQGFPLRGSWLVCLFIYKFASYGQA